LPRTKSEGLEASQVRRGPVLYIHGNIHASLVLR
jgi:hypothetical protein